MNITLLTYDTIDSTNTEALKHARQGADEGLCIVARQQTAGRGRHGRVWVSESDAGLYFSIVLRPRLEIQFLPLITLMAGVAVHDTLREFGLSPDIKWVNDVLVNEKKISGILAETTETKTGLAVVVGIGINIRSSNFPPELIDRATSIEAAHPANGNQGSHAAAVPSAEQLTQVLVKYLTYFYHVILSENGPSIIDEWRRRSTYFSEKQVRIVLENETLEGATDGLEPNGALRLRKADGSIAIIRAGDLERLRSRNG